MSDLRKRANEFLEQAGTKPGNVDVTAVEPLLDADDGYVRHTALRTLALVASENPDQVLPVVETVRSRVDDSYAVASSTAMVILSFVGETNPAEVRPVVPEIVDRLDNPSPGYRFRAASALVPLADPSPEVVVDYADDLADLLVDTPVVSSIRNDALEEENLNPGRIKTMEKARSRDRGRSIAYREILAHLLVCVADADPAAIVDRLDDVAEELPESKQPVRQALVEVFRHVAESNDVDVSVPIDPLQDLLEDDDPTVQARAVRTLGFAEATETIPALRALAERDGNETVSELARETADWLAQRT
ncbi:HEAT repeat domain-containing protein [Natrarchaeobius chitinivorans]|uniref:HEAT repeat domain-containing protein n=1 Tax=Natrarchaeobius chitinivorans TaxID=1679083 RepID=A0A3N6LV48_NATCH|nr:HEAT repeat domain-containing protein [Natrarchaeobius chitinivorans]RQG94238.1 hypothetical protein EA473_12770 [Natrarchaeobius chitinivorans]